MNKNSSKCNEKFWNLSLPFEVERLDKLDTEFRSKKEVQELLNKKAFLHEFLMNAVPEAVKSALLEYDDTGFHIGDLQRKFHYKKGFFDCSAIMRFLFRMKNNIKLNIRIL